MQDTAFLPREALQRLLDLLVEAGYQVIGPCVRDAAIQFSPISDVAQLPRGWTDDQAPGSYRLSEVDSSRCFAWANGPQALKPLLFSPTETLWQAQRNPQGELSFEAAGFDGPPLAVIGVRACDLAALAIHDRHFLGECSDPAYAARRNNLFLVAVHCAFPADTCFCASTGDGPEAKTGYDIALHELDDGYLLRSGSDRGASLLHALPVQDSDTLQREAFTAAIEEATKRQFRALPPGNLQPALFSRLGQARWEAIARRCLGCGNCTSVCPTCFCHAEHDEPRLGGKTTVHRREWDSCFSAGHSQLHGFQVRPGNKERYRQWLTHKLGSWHQQFGRSGCVGCGRCITWCPVGIDITAETQAICAAEATGETH